MNKTEASVSLFTITFFAAVQYAFLAGVPDSVSHFAFLFITGIVGFFITLLLFFNELNRIDKKQVLQSLVMAAETLGFNLFLLLGSSGVGATVSACVLSAYFVFIPVISLVLFKEKPEKNSLIGIAVVLLGLFFMMDLNVKGLMDVHILYLLIADIFFAGYIITAERFTTGSNPSILVMGEQFFRSMMALICWAIGAKFSLAQMRLPTDPAFWGSVIFISFFMRGVYGVVQLYAQRYVSALSVSLIFSTEIIMTMAVSPVLTAVFGSAPEKITVLRVIGAVVMVAGILLADSTVFGALERRLRHEKK